MTPRLIARTLKALALALALALASSAHAVLWVSPNGDDAGPGSEEQPLRTIARARDLVRTLNRDMTDDITVFIAGEHRIDQPLQFGPEDSGTNGFSIIYTAAPGEHPVISGGYHVVGWKLADGERNLWSAPAPAGLSNTYSLYVNGNLASRTRGRLLQFFARNAPTSKVAGPDPSAQWKNLGDVVFQAPGAGSIWSETSASAPPFVENAFELLGVPGEWYFDRPAHLIYYTPRVGEEMVTADVVAPSAVALLRCAGTKEHPMTGLVFKGIRFEFTTVPSPLDASPDGSASRPAPGPAVSVALASGIQLLEDEFLHLSTPALRLGPGLEGCTLDGCAFGQISWSAIHVEDAAGVRIAENRFTYVGVEHPEAGVIVVDRSREVTIENNQIDHFPGLALPASNGRPGDPIEAANRVSQPMVGFHGVQPPDAAAPAGAGIPAAYRGLAEARFGSLTIPCPPTRVAAEAEDRLAYVTWIPSCRDGGAPVLYYTVAASTGTVMVVNAEDFQATGYVVFDGLENGRGVTFSVAAANRIGSSRPSPPTCSVTPSRKRKLSSPPAPTLVSVSSSSSGTTVQITPAAPDGGSPVVAYRLTAGRGAGQHRLLEGLDVIHSDPAHPITRTLSGLKLPPGTPVSVAAQNAAGESKPVTVVLRD